MKGGEASLREGVSKKRNKSEGNYTTFPLGKVTGILSSDYEGALLISPCRLKSIRYSVAEVCKTSLLYVYSMKSRRVSVRG
jgi:hypothetical protein